MMLYHLILSLTLINAINAIYYYNDFTLHNCMVILFYIINNVVLCIYHMMCCSHCSLSLYILLCPFPININDFAVLKLFYGWLSANFQLKCVYVLVSWLLNALSLMLHAYLYVLLCFCLVELFKLVVWFFRLTNEGDTLFYIYFNCLFFKFNLSIISSLFIAKISGSAKRVSKQKNLLWK